MAAHIVEMSSGKLEIWFDTWPVDRLSHSGVLSHSGQAAIARQNSTHTMQQTIQARNDIVRRPRRDQRTVA
jgi:hypothetical protein